MVKFENIEIEGFGSIANLKFNLDRGPGNIVIIRGKNGAGKTTIFSALIWGIYGEPLKEKSQVETWDYSKPENFKGTKVTVNFSIDSKKYTIIRCKGYKGKVLGATGKDRLILIEDGKEREDLRDKANVKNEIIKILGISLSVCRNSIVFGQKLKRVIEESGPDKKKIFDEVFDTSFINEAKAAASADLDSKEKELSYALIGLSSLKDNIANNISAIESLKLSKKALRVRAKDRVNKLLSELKDLKSQLKVMEPGKLKKLQDELNKLSARRKSKSVYLTRENEIKRNIFRTELEISQKEGEIENFTKLINGAIRVYKDTRLVCSECGQKIPEKKVIAQKKKLKSDISNLKQNRIACENELKATKSRFNAETAQLSRVSQYTKEINSIENRSIELASDIKVAEYQIAKLPEIREKIAKIREQISGIKSGEDTEPIDKAILAHEGKIVKLEESRAVKQSEVDKLTKEAEILQWLVSVPLSNSGLKAFIFNHMISHINSILSNYSKFTGFNIKFVVNLDSAHKDISIFIYKGENTIVPYFNLSGGEKQLTDVCIAFALHDFITQKANFNIMVMDEVFESLDSNNIELVSSIIEEKVKGKTLYLITHLSEFSYTHSTNLEVYKKSGITKVR